MPVGSCETGEVWKQRFGNCSRPALLHSSRESGKRLCTLSGSHILLSGRVCRTASQNEALLRQKRTLGLPREKEGLPGMAPIMGSHRHRSSPLILTTCLQGEEGILSPGRDGADPGRCSNLPKSHSSLSSGSSRAQDLFTVECSCPGVAAAV